MVNPQSSCPAPGSRRSAFALVISLVLMGMILMLLMALITFVRVETASAEISALRQKAQQNALLGLMVAVGDLQKYAGPDQRITARGRILVKEDKGLDDPLDPTADGRAMWSGVSYSDGDPDEDPDKDFFTFANGERVRWLVSGLSDFDSENPKVAPENSVVFHEAGSYKIMIPGAAKPEDGAEVEAGLVEIYSGNDSEVTGGYAYLVDDEGVKGKLRTRAGENEYANYTTGLVLPGNYNPKRLTGLESLAGSGTPSELDKVSRLANLALFNDTIELEPHQFDFTFNSFGVLSDTREGGIRGDLSLAFENKTVFDDAFDDGDQLLVDETKLASAGELETNDYISWKIFRDYYRMKDRIANNGSISAASMALKENAVGYTYAGALENHGSFKHGPHAFKRYADNTHYRYLFAPKDDTYNPLKPILAYMYFETWVNLRSEEVGEEGEEETKYYADSYVRPWFGFYNPYNVTLKIAEAQVFLDQNIAIRLIDADGIKELRDSYKYDDTDEDGNPITKTENIDSEDGWLPILRYGSGEDDTRFVSPKNSSYSIGPGEVIIFSAKTDHDLAGDGEPGDGDFGEVLTNKYEEIGLYGIYRTFEIIGDPVAPFTVEVQTYHAVGSKGNDERPYFITASDIMVPYQWMIFPYAYDAVKTYKNNHPFPGKRVVISDVDLGVNAKLGEDSAVNYGNAARFGMWLRTTTEGVDQIRPLIDANLRAAFVNPRWDVDAYDTSKTGLGIRTPASYTGAPVETSDKGKINDEVKNEKHNSWGIYEMPPYVGLFPSANKSGDRATGLWGPSHDSSTGGGGVTSVVLFDVPREPLVSLGQLQHAEAGRFSYEPTYVVGNSYANLRIPLDAWVYSASDTFSDWDGLGQFKISGEFNLYDASYLVNEVLWDSYLFSTIPAAASEEELADFLAGTTRLPNPRYIPYEPQGLKFNRSSLVDSPIAAFQHRAGLLLSDGAFNVNSTSVGAWEAFLSSTAGLPVGKIDEKGEIDEDELWTSQDVRFPRVTHSAAGVGDAWAGYAELNTTQVRALAEAVVSEILQRGPFRSLGEFVNRWNPDDEDVSILPKDERRKSGALQAALDKSINASSSIASQSSPATGFPAIPAGASQATGFPGHILQGDILQALSPYMAVRSDTFRVRAMGRVVNPVTGVTEVEAWCEAIVQRLPDPVLTGSTVASLTELADPSSEFGRRFDIVSFRWLEEGQL